MSHFSHIKYAALSDVGRKRRNNEDSFGVFPDAGVFCVADGMGGGDDGEVASAATVKAVETFASENPLPHKLAYPIDSVVSAIRAAVNSASAWIFNRAREKHLKGCGSTFVGVCFDPSSPSEAIALHAGDSRLYRVRGRSIQQITTDHSAAEIIGAKNEDEINPMFRGMILRAVGIQPKVEVDATPFQIRQGDRIVICSDGLSKMIPDKRIAAIARDSSDAEVAVRGLIDAANQAGGLDNVTAVVIEIGMLPQALPTTEMPLWNVADVKEELYGAEGHTLDTHGDTGVTFDFGSASGSNSTTGSGGHTESATGFTITIPEESTNDPVSADMPLTVETSGISVPESGAEAGVTVRKGVGKVALISSSAVLAAVTAVVIASLSGGGGLSDEDRRKSPGAGERVPVVFESRSSANEGGDRSGSVPDKASETEAARNRTEAEEVARRTEESRNRAEAEEVARRAEELRRKAEDARKEARRRQEEARMAREQAEADRKLREEERKRQEAERKRRLEDEEARRRAEEDRKLREEKIRLDAERTERLRRERIERERAAEEKALAEKIERERAAAKEARHRRLAFTALKNASNERTATAFVRKVKSIVKKGTLDSVCQVFYPMSHAANEEESSKAAAELAKCMQTVVARLVEYAEIYRNDVRNELRDPLTSPGYKKEIKDVPSKMEEFLRNSERILGKDVTHPDVHMACALIIEMVPVWF